MLGTFPKRINICNIGLHIIIYNDTAVNLDFGRLGKLDIRLDSYSHDDQVPIDLRAIGEYKTRCAFSAFDGGCIFFQYKLHALQLKLALEQSGCGFVKLSLH
ncbi:hypothetical protein D3C78_1683230 [compost metagenome]